MPSNPFRLAHSIRVMFVRGWIDPEAGLENAGKMRLGCEAEPQGDISNAHPAHCRTGQFFAGAFQAL